MKSLFRGAVAKMNLWATATMCLCILAMSAAAQTQTPPKKKIRVSEEVERSMLKKEVKPQLPADAKHLKTAVVLAIEVDPQGNVVEAHVESGSPLLVPAAIEAVKEWKFKPYLIQGEAIYVDTLMTVKFKK